MEANTPDYLNPDIPAGLEHIDMPVVVANEQTLKGYGSLVPSNYQDFPVEIVRWPAQGWRPVDLDSGNEGGTTEGIFRSQWDGDVLYGMNEAVGGHYILGYATAPELARRDYPSKPQKILLWHCNYHPDGGQLFFPLEPKPFVVPLALPGDNIQPKDFVCFWFDGSAGLYIHPNIWHDGVFTLQGHQRFFDKQGAVHARVSVDFVREFKCLMRVNLDHVPAK